MTFDKQTCLGNIRHLAKEKGINIGELETGAGVSPGYLSRIGKEDNKSSPSIEVLVSMAEKLGISLDTLISVNITDLSPTDKYIVSFLEKLKRDTHSGTLEWNRESADYLNRMESDCNGYVEHPLFNLETFYEEGEGDYPDQVTRVVMLSHAFECHTYIDGDCFNLKLKNGASLYFMKICKSVFHKNDPDTHSKELWMCQPGNSPQFLCSTLNNPALRYPLEQLHEAVTSYFRHPQIRHNVRSIIDAFMNDDWGDDDDPQLPF